VVASHFQLSAVDQQLLESKLERQKRARRDRGEHARQAQRGLLLRIEKKHFAKLERWHPTARSHLDAADANRHAERPARALLDRATPLLDVGQNPPMECQPRDQQ
jgi:predicted component of type VI protein secretion system